jgi:4-carboxymuconolactone decarboxylase
MVDVPNRPEYRSELFKKGLAVRREVLGADYVDASLARADDFNAAFRQMSTEIAWGMCWNFRSLGLIPSDIKISDEVWRAST